MDDVYDSGLGRNYLKISKLFVYYTSTKSSDLFLSFLGLYDPTISALHGRFLALN